MEGLSLGCNHQSLCCLYLDEGSCRIRVYRSEGINMVGGMISEDSADIRRCSKNEITGRQSRCSLREGRASIHTVEPRVDDVFPNLGYPQAMLMMLLLRRRRRLPARMARVTSSSFAPLLEPTVAPREFPRILIPTKHLATRSYQSLNNPS